MKNQTSDTYNFIKPPLLDNKKHMIVFAFSKFIIEDDKQRSALYRDLSKAITDKDFIKMNRILCDLEQFRTKAEVRPQFKQTEIRTVSPAQKRRPHVKEN